MFKNSKGFTLIELMVVISIISLLSSVVLAAVSDARDKAKAKAFRQEVLQFVNALELYKADNGVYPGQDDYNNQYSLSQTGVEASSFFFPTFQGLLSPYLTSIPKPKIPGGIVSANTIWYRADNPASSPRWQCEGDVDFPPYVIYFVNSSTFAVPGFEDWPRVQLSINGGTSFITFPYSRCFSLK